jgi:hypothetical protein
LERRKQAALYYCNCITKHTYENFGIATDGVVQVSTVGVRPGGVSRTQKWNPETAWMEPPHDHVTDLAQEWVNNSHDRLKLPNLGDGITHAKSDNRKN